MHTTNQPPIHVTRVPAFKDNYLWIAKHPDACLLIDPGEAQPMLDTLNSLQLVPDAILITHRHWDHVDGVNAIANHYRIPVYAPKGVQRCRVDIQVTPPQTLTFGGLSVDVIDLAGHTDEHVGYVITKTKQPIVFVGDTLFGAGCGRLFDGNPERLWRSIEALLKLPDSTLVYCAHEYTRANLQFAHSIEPDNSALNQRIQHTSDNSLPTIPTTIGLEKATNPFCRTRLLAQTPAWQGKTPSQIFTQLRAMKDRF